MPRFFTRQELNKADFIVISGEDAHHIIKVLRYKIGDFLELSDGKSIVANSVIEDIDHKEQYVKLRILEKTIVESINPKITLFQGIPKGDKFDFIIQKGTEIGVSKFVPVKTARTIVEFSKDKLQRRKERWYKIAKEASKQCRRTDIPEISGVINFSDSMEKIKDYDLAIIPWELEKTKSLKTVLRNENKDVRNIAVFIGPEGGFAEAEVALARRTGVISVSLGSRILRTETAAIAVCTAIMYEIGDFGGL